MRDFWSLRALSTLSPQFRSARKLPRWTLLLFLPLRLSSQMLQCTSTRALEFSLPLLHLGCRNLSLEQLYADQTLVLIRLFSPWGRRIQSLTTDRP
jgi:hypothetical protein